MTLIRAVIFLLMFSFILTLSSLGSATILLAVATIASIGLLILYGILICLKIFYYKEFCAKRGRLTSVLLYALLLRYQYYGFYLLACFVPAYLDSNNNLDAKLCAYCNSNYSGIKP